MGGGRQCVRFEAVDMLAAAMPEVMIETKNTFVHFQPRDAKARRGTFSGGLLSLRRGSCEESPAGRRHAARGNTRAVTFPPHNVHVAEVVRIPEFSRVEGFRRSSVMSGSTDCPSPTLRRLSVLSLCFDTPTASECCVTPMSFTQGYSQGCVTPVNFTQCQQMPNFQSPVSTPRTTGPSPWASPMSCQQVQTFQSPVSTPPWALPMPCQQMQTFQSPVNTPRTTGPSPWASPVVAPQAAPAYAQGSFPQAWQPLQSAEEPKKKSRRNKVAQPAKENEWTLLLRHLPLEYSPDALLAEFKEFLPFIDFYYLPTSFETKKNLGYAFVNFCDRDAAARFTEFWEKSGIPESDDLPVQDARMQGYAANVDRFRNSSVMGVLTADLKPRVFCRGVPQPFPVPAKRLPSVGSRFRPTAE